MFFDKIKNKSEGKRRQNTCTDLLRSLTPAKRVCRE